MAEAILAVAAKIGAVAMSIATNLGAPFSVALKIGQVVTAIANVAIQIGIQVGIAYAMRPSVPDPGAGSVPYKSGTPARVRGYGIARIGLPSVLAEG